MNEQLIFSNRSHACTGTKLELVFCTCPEIALDRTVFAAPGLHGKAVAVRGNNPGAYSGAATFQWYLGPQALMVFFLRAVSTEYAALTPVLEGGAGTLAACLDTLIEKSSYWTNELFGWKEDGTPIIKRMLKRRNAGRRRGGEVAISLNENFLPASVISVTLDGRPVTEKSELKRLADLVEFQWLANKSRRAIALAKRLQ